mgnify:CR=1 FL=1
MPEVITTPGIFTSPTYVGEGASFLSEPFTTTRSGRLLLSKMVSAIASCTGASDGRLLFLRVDGVAVRTSAHYFTTAAFGSLRLVGVTDTVVNAGAHTVDVAVECLGSSTSSGLGGNLISNTAIVVLR